MCTTGESYMKVIVYHSQLVSFQEIVKQVMFIVEINYLRPFTTINVILKIKK